MNVQENAGSGANKSDNSRWETHSPTSVSYFPSKSKRDFLGSEIKLEINGKASYCFNYSNTFYFCLNFLTYCKNYQTLIKNQL